MPALKPISREYRVYLALWRKAVTSEAPIKIKCSNWSMAIAMRQGMYRAIRPFRHGTMNDEQLLQASEKFVVYLECPESKDKSLPHFLVLKERKALAELEEMFDELGIDEEDLLFGDEMKVQKSLTALIDEHKTPRNTPFYSRED